jgi:hypothetical protein
MLSVIANATSPSPEKTSAAPALCMNSVWARKSARAAHFG